MTIGIESRRVRYFGNGLNMPYAFSFKIFQASDLLVVVHYNPVVGPITLVMGLDYTVQLNANQDMAPGGTVTLVTPLQVGHQLTLVSSVAYTQDINITNQGGFYPSVLNNGFDKLTVLIQQVRDIAINGPIGIPTAVAGVPITVAGGTSDAITANFLPYITLTNGAIAIVRAGAANTTTTPTLAVDGTAARTIVKENNQPLAVGDIAGAGHWLQFNLDIALNRWVLQNPAEVVLGASQVEMEAGTESALRLMSPLRVRQGSARDTALRATAPIGFSTTATLSNAHLNIPMFYNSASAGTLTLPSAPFVGGTITVYCLGEGACTLVRSGTSLIFALGVSAATSIVLNRGVSVTLIFDGTNWVQAAGGMALTVPGSAPLYACRAWVNFNGTGTVAIRASGNVSSITDNGVGDYTVNFATAMVDANYAFVSTAGDSNRVGLIQPPSANFQVGSCRFLMVSRMDTEGLIDTAHVCCAFFR